MSYSQDVKNELLTVEDTARHCRIAELCGIFCHLGSIETRGGVPGIRIRSDSEALIRKCFTLALKSFNIESGAYPPKASGIRGGEQPFGDGISGVARNFEDGFIVKGPEDTEVFSRGLKLSEERDAADPVLLHHECCKRAFLRGAFLAAGSMSDPNSSYHLEFVCQSLSKARQLKEVMTALRIPPRVIERKGRSVVYLKDGAGIVDLLGLMGAHRSLMELENLRIIKEMRGSINRRVNCETANISKTVTASSKQIEDIILIRDHAGLSSLPSGLRDMAAVRLDYPDVPLKDLGQLLDPPIGKSGVNHRLRKLGEIADRIREGL